MSAVQAVTAAKFLRKTALRDTEANTNFRMLDDDVAEAITSAAADEVTPLMSKVYTRLILTPAEWREGERVLRFAGQEREGKWVTAWEQLRRHLRVSSETANKALRWMHCQGIIGYYSGKNGVGIRIFLNRAANSVTQRREAKTQKILSLAPASGGLRRTSPVETPFNDSFAVSEVLDSDVNPRAPKNGAGHQLLFEKRLEQLSGPSAPPTPESRPDEKPSSLKAPGVEVPVERIVSRLRDEIGPALQRMARQAAAGEHERTREWLESKGLPKAARVAQRETYEALRRQGLLKEAPRSSHAEVGRGAFVPSAPRPLPEGEILELAEACVALFEVRGQPVELTLSEMNVASGGFLLPEDASRVLEKVEFLLATSRSREGREGF
ncbi:MAG: hypothetical protein LC795_08885 [Acidobacteria bacterium]|nr:hypothetical protein [Acidobacteriota bacterium]